jgi:hypothetical protein
LRFQNDIANKRSAFNNFTTAIFDRENLLFQMNRVAVIRPLSVMPPILKTSTTNKELVCSALAKTETVTAAQLAFPTHFKRSRAAHYPLMHKQDIRAERLHFQSHYSSSVSGLYADRIRARFQSSPQKLTSLDNE